MIIFVLFHLITFTGSFVASVCFKENTSWSHNVIINMLDSVPNYEECQTLCQDELQCVAWTWTSNNNPDLKEGCILFSSIGQPISINDSVSGPCSCTCSEQFACSSDEENTVDRILDVRKEEDCQDLCLNNSDCQIYTCSCPKKDYSCNGCVTGPKSCDQSLVTTTQEPETQFAIIITGGSDDRSDSDSRSVEALREDGSSLCTLPDLPNDYYRHTQSGLVTCGGYFTTSSCIRLIDGKWSQSNTLKHSRQYHTSWTSSIGTLLMGGSGSRTTTELLTDDGQSVELFPLQYNTDYACSIQLEDIVILTGGGGTRSTVSVYSTEGWVEDLPDLLTGRYHHGCGHYVNNDNKMVYLVTGGWSGSTRLASTEILIFGSDAWTQVGNLPTGPIYALRGVSFNNKIIMTGGFDDNGRIQDSVLIYNITDETWTQVGTMREARYYHGVSVVQLDQIIDYCN